MPSCNGRHLAQWKSTSLADASADGKSAKWCNRWSTCSRFECVRPNEFEAHASKPRIRRKASRIVCDASFTGFTRSGSGSRGQRAAGLSGSEEPLSHRVWDGRAVPRRATWDVRSGSRFDQGLSSSRRGGAAGRPFRQAAGINSCRMHSKGVERSNPLKLATANSPANVSKSGPLPRERSGPRAPLPNTFDARHGARGA